MNKTFNIYCDESCHIENDHKAYMFLGSISVAYNQVRFHTEQINQLKKKHNFYAEIKWSKVSKSKLRFYLELVDYFFNTDLQFRSVGVKKEKINNDAFNQTYDDFYYKMYYYLLNHNLNSLYNYNVYLDIKDTLSAYKVNRLKNILNTKFGVFRNVQNIRSHESILIQIADFMMGAISYLHNDENKQNSAKMQIIDKIRSHCNDQLMQTNYSNKMNLFFIELR
ncbi:RlfA protein [Flavobacterium psychrophilum]|nr:RlfA protein [Flavobacterium psychrophilum]AOE52959.1 RlfA protein [Flavobacterium psychrophilum]